LHNWIQLLSGGYYKSALGEGQLYFSVHLVPKTENMGLRLYVFLTVGTPITYG
jgi:hypothetical protein